MRKIDKKLNIQKANILAENLYINSKINEAGPIGQEGISKRLAELNDQKERLMEERKKISAKIIEINNEIKKWSKDISPNQMSMFDDL